MRLFPLAFLLLLPQESKIEIRVMAFAAKEAEGDFSEICREFEKENPGVQVKTVVAGGGDSLTKLKLMLSARQQIDIAHFDILEFSMFLNDNILLDLQPFIDCDPTWNVDEYFLAVLKAWRGPEGHQYGLPGTFTPYVMYYNKDIFDQEGIPYPKAGWTWDDLLTIARKCTRPPNQYGISITQWIQALSPWIWQNGGEFVDEKITKCTMDSPQAIKAIKFLTDMFFVEKIASTDATYEAQLIKGYFQAGRAALYGPSGYWETYRFKDIKKFRWDVCPLPRGKYEATSIALGGFVGIRHTKHPELTYKLLRKISSEKMLRALARIGNGVPSNKKAAYSEDFLKPSIPPDSEQVFIDVLPHARLSPVLTNWREIESTIKAELDGCLVLNKFDAETACRRITTKINDLLNRYRKEKEGPYAPIGLLLLISGLIILILLTLFFLKKSLSSLRHRIKEERFAFACIALWAIGFIAFTLLPMIGSLGLSLTVWSPIRPIEELRWAGGDNYVRMSQDENFFKALQVTAYYSLLSVPLSLIVALGLALLVQRGFVMFRTIFYLPVIASAVAVGIIWRWIYGEAWIKQEALIIPGFVFMSLWNVGGPMLVFIAGLQSINPTLYEVARLDGASKWRQLIHITIPQLTPVILFNLIIGIIGAFQTFAQPYIMTQGGPGNASLFYVLYLYQNAFKFHHIGYACALGWILLLILLLLTLILMKSSRRWVHYEGETT